MGTLAPRLLLPLDGRGLRRSPPRRRTRTRSCRLLGRHRRLPGIEVGGAVAGFEGAHDDGRRVRVRGQLLAKR